MQFDVEYVRRQFSALERSINGYPVAYLDGPGGTQVPQRVLDAIVEYLARHNSNVHGAFATSQESDAVLEHGHDAAADFLGCDADEVSFGANMTTMTLLLAQAVGRELSPGDEILVTQLDHEANRGPWDQLGDGGIVIREAPINLETCTIDWPALEELVGERTRVVAVGHASNAVGTVNDVRRAASRPERWARCRW